MIEKGNKTYSWCCTDPVTASLILNRYWHGPNSEDIGRKAREPVFQHCFCFSDLLTRCLQNNLVDCMAQSSKFTGNMSLKSVERQSVQKFSTTQLNSTEWRKAWQLPRIDMEHVNKLWVYCQTERHWILHWQPFPDLLWITKSVDNITASAIRDSNSGSVLHCIVPCSISAEFLTTGINSDVPLVVFA